jgi:hypothetical protein
MGPQLRIEHHRVSRRLTAAHDFQDPPVIQKEGGFLANPSS